MIVSDRVGVLAVSTKRRSEPSTRIVCGPPGSTSSRTPGLLIPGIGLETDAKMSEAVLTCSSAAVATAAVVLRTIVIIPSRKRL